jgi:hypothetical protein
MDDPMTKQLDHQALVDFTRRWFALWTEADPQARSMQVAQLWAPAGAQVLMDPPQEVRDAAGDAVLLAAGLVGLGWEMVAVADGTVAGSGYDVMVFDDDGRILLDHQHIALS